MRIQIQLFKFSTFSEEHSHFSCCAIQILLENVENLNRATGKIRALLRECWEFKLCNRTFSTAQQKKWERYSNSQHSRQRNRKNESAIQILNILDSATEKIRALFKFTTFSTVQQEKWERYSNSQHSRQRNRKNDSTPQRMLRIWIAQQEKWERSSENLENLNSATGKMRALLRESWEFE